MRCTASRGKKSAQVLAWLAIVSAAASTDSNVTYDQQAATVHRARWHTLPAPPPCLGLRRHRVRAWDKAARNGAGERGTRHHLLRLRQRYFKTATRLRTCAKINTRGCRLQTPRATHRFSPPRPAKTLAGECVGNGIAHGCSASSTIALNLGHE